MSTYEDPHREIGHREIPAGHARTAVMRRRYDASIEDVWEACTDPERLGRWFLPVSGDLRPGGSFSIQDNASGQIRVCDPPHRLTLSWAYGDRPVDEFELRLSPGTDGDTILEIEHATVSGKVEWEGELYDSIFGVATGWEPALYALDAHLRGESPDEIEGVVTRAERAWTALVDRD